MKMKMDYHRFIQTTYINNDMLCGGTNIGPYWFPHPYPRRQQKSRARGANRLRKKTCPMIFFDLYEGI